MLKNYILPQFFAASLVLMSACSITNNITPNTPSPSPSNAEANNSLPDSLKNGLVLYLPFEDNANDLSDNKNNGTIKGNVTFTSGKIGKAAFFNATPATESYIIVKNSDKLSLKNTFSITAWANSNLKPEVLYYPILTKGNEHEDYTMWFNAGGADLLLNWGTDNEFWSHLENTGNDRIMENKWIHLAITYDGSKIKYYNDGVLTHTYDYNKNLDNNNEDLTIAASLPGSLELFKGMIDEIRIYDRAISESEVNALVDQK